MHLCFSLCLCICIYGWMYTVLVHESMYVNPNPVNDIRFQKEHVKKGKKTWNIKKRSLYETQQQLITYLSLTYLRGRMRGFKSPYVREHLRHKNLEFTRRIKRVATKRYRAFKGSGDIATV